jgi:transglutaminase-like putative cysteine protease
MNFPMLAAILASSSLVSAPPSTSLDPTSSPFPGDKNLVKNGSFESGGKSVEDWYPVYPRSLATIPPVHEPNKDDAKEGKRAASIVVDYAKGYTSWTQTVALPKDTRSIHLEGWGRLDRLTNDGYANLLVTFLDPSRGKDGEGKYVVRFTEKLQGLADWTKLSLDAAIPEGCEELYVRCGVGGPCAASFDDIVLTASENPVSMLDLRSAVGDYNAEANVDTEDPRVRMSIPFPIGSQTPLAIRVTSEPAGAVASLGIVREQENRPLEIRLHPMKAGEQVALRVETLTMIEERELSDGSGVRLLRKERIPKSIEAYMLPAEGIEVESPAIVEAAATLEGKDLGSVMESLSSYLKANMTYDAGESQGAEHCLASGKAVCTGYANTAAALLIARGVPARVLACTFPETRLQEHYVIEAWTKELAWSRMESTAGLFPYADSASLILRVVYPDSERSPFDVPLYKDASEGMSCRFRMDDKHCWQGGHVHKPVKLMDSAPAEARAVARAAFEELADEPSPGPVWIFTGKDADVPKGTDGLVSRVREWASEPGELN